MIAKSIIVTYDQKRRISQNNNWLFNGDDLNLMRFECLTTGCSIVMGRKTHESIGRVLPNRTNIIVTRNQDDIPLGTPAYITESLTAAIEIAENTAVHDGLWGEIFFIGGGEIYKQALPLCDKMYISEFKNNLDGDIFFPDFDINRWKEIVSVPVESHTFRLLERISKEQNHQKRDKEFEKS